MGSLAGAAAPKPFNTLLSGLQTTIFSQMTALAVKHHSVNLGQGAHTGAKLLQLARAQGARCGARAGFPDDEGPESMKRIVGSAVLDPKRSNQYPPFMGVPELRQAAARHSQAYNGLPVDWQTEAGPS